MKTTLLALTSAGALLAALPAQAALTDYVFSGTMVNGATFNGGFTVDDTKSSFQQFSNSVVYYGGATFTRVSGLSSGEPNLYSLGLMDTTSGNQFEVGFFADRASTFKITNIPEGDLRISSTRFYTGGLVFTYAQSGTISRANAGPVPEPATWAMMILGFGVIGYAMRRKTVLRYV